MAFKILTAVLLASGLAKIQEAVQAAKPEELSADILALAEANQAAAKSLEVSEKNLEEALKVNDKLASKIVELSTAKPAEATKLPESLEFEFEGNKYGFALKKVSLKGNYITDVEVCADKALQKQLISINSGMIFKKK